MSQIETLWETYDFILLKITNLEDEVSYLLDQNISINDESFHQKVQELINCYNKQLLTIQEIKNFAEDNSLEIPEARQVAMDVLDELASVTEELKSAMKQNIKKRFDN
tara:strand:+ start:114 stop:437 length:324 start_codon:yes stop_codon:yes gene_type:complete